MAESHNIQNVKWAHKDLLGIKYLSKEELNLIFQTAKSFKEISQRNIKKVPALRGKTVVCLFYEPSTRTRMSFELAAKRLSADVVNVAVASSSVTKGETLIDTVKNIEAMNVDTIIIRHTSSGAPLLVSKNTSAAVINAGDGCNEHPTQALLDMFTILEHKGKINDLKVSIIGDILHSRVARSNIWGLAKLGAQVTVCGPYSLIPRDIEKTNVTVTSNIEEAVNSADVIMPLRLQLERQQQALFPSSREYSMRFGVTHNRIKNAKKDVVIMHPGPINRGIEISNNLADDPRSVILNQVTNGIAIRMAVLFLLNSFKEKVRGK